MKKKLLIALVIILLITVVGIAFLTSQANSYLQEYKPKLEQLASNSLGAAVSVEELGVRLFPSAKVVASNLLVKRKKDSANGLKLENLTFHVKLLPLLSGTIEILELSLISPDISFVKAKEGIFIEGLPKPKVTNKKAKKVAPPQEQAKQKEGKAKGQPLPEWLSLSLDTFSIQKAKFSLKDESSNQVQTVENVSVKAGMVVGTDTVILKNIKVQGTLPGSTSFRTTADKISYSLSKGTAQIPGMEVQLGESLIPLKVNYKPQGKAAAVDFGIGKNAVTSEAYIDLPSLMPLLNAFSPAVKGIETDGRVDLALEGTLITPMNLTMDGNLALKDVGAKVSNHTISKTTGTILVKAKPHTKEIVSEDIALQLNTSPVEIKTLIKVKGASNSQLALEKLTINAFDGVTEIKSNATLDGAKPFDAAVSVANVSIEKALAGVKPDLPLTLSGNLEAFTVNVEGSQGDNLMNSLNGQGKVKLVNGVLKGTNIAGSVLKALADLPFVAGQMMAHVPQEEKESLKADDTVIKNLEGAFTIQAQRLATKKLLLESSFFRVLSSGSVSFTGDCDLKSSIIFSKSFSAALVKAIKELKYGLNDQEELVVPVTLRGNVSSLNVLPSFDELMKSTAGGALKEKAGSLLDKALGGSDKDGSDKGKAIKDLFGF